MDFDRNTFVPLYVFPSQEHLELDDETEGAERSISLLDRKSVLLNYLERQR